MAVGFSNTNKPLNPRGNDASPKGYNRAALYSGKALDFDGVNDYVGLDGFTLSGTSATFVFNFNTDVLDVFRYVFDILNNRFIIGFGSTSGVIQLYDGTFKNIFTPTIGEWYNLAVSVNGTTANCYVNGVLETTLTIAAINLGSATQTSIGSGANKGGSFWQGYISGAKIFNTALTAAQVADLYNNPEKVVPTGVDNTALKLWLPMQEGAGTTAYDGSGNGNHGTISGATYVNGVGAPVSQTAVIDWNKGTNLVPYSEDLSDSQWDKSATRITYAVDQTTAPDGRTTADEITESATGGDHLVFGSYTTSTFTDYTASIYMKDNTRGFGFVQIAPNSASSSKRYTIVVDLSNGSVTDTAGNSTGASYDVSDAGNGWYRISVTRPHESGSSVFIVYGLSDSGTPTYDDQFEPTYTGDGTSSLYVWGASLTASSAVTPYIPTFATAQTTPVLLPQGLTSGRDITGVNLFENVRKQGALNLDGNSWAEVHDNASLDVSEITAEGWMYAESITSVNNRIVNKWDAAYPERSFQLYGQNNTINWMLSEGSAAYSITGGTLTQGQWHHVVGTYDGTTQKIYLNGVQVATTALSITLKQSSFKVMLGGYTTGLYSLNPIAQPRIYDRALTAAEVLQNYNSGKNTYK